MRVAILADFPLHVIPEFGEGFRPAGHWATWLPQVAQQFGLQVDFEFHWLVLSEKVEKSRVVFFQNQTFHVFPTATSGRAASLFREDRRIINECLRQVSPDLVHGWGTEDVYALAAVRSGFLNIVSMQGILSYYALKNRLPARAYLQALLELYILRRASLVTTESEWGRKVILRRSPHARVELVEYGVQDHFFDVVWNPDPNKPVVIFVGSVDPRKGIQDLVEAFRSPELAFAELWVVGGTDTDWAASLKKGSPVNIHWLGRHSTGQTADLMRRAWCLALPTRADTSPNVVKEARVIGLPVVTSPHGGQTTYIAEGETGFLIEPGNNGELSKCLARLMQNFAFCQKLGRHLREQHRELLRPSRTATEFIKLYSELCRERPKSAAGGKER